MDKAEILCYLRTASKTDDPGLAALIDSCIAEVNAAVRPKTLHRIFACTVSEGETKIGDFTFSSRRLAQTLAGCNAVCVFGATLGTESDRLLRTYAGQSIARATVLQAVLAAKIEEVCDDLETGLRAEGLTLRQRYSPGYFDLEIREQKKIFAMLDLTKRIGIICSDTCQMIPTKSVTAIIGIEPTEAE